jgi:hypothetical protein
MMRDMGKLDDRSGKLLPWLVILLIAAFVWYRAWSDLHQANLSIETPSSTVVWALAAYVVSQGLRFLRFSLLIGPFRLRQLAQLYLITAGASLAIPFKLGELFRLGWIAKTTGNMRQSILLIWVERLLDASAIALMYLFLSLTDSPQLQQPTGALYAIPPIILVSILIFRILPENMRNLNLWIMRSYKGASAVSRLRLLRSVALFTTEANKILGNKFSSMIGLTICIWAFECFSIHLALQPASTIQHAITMLINKLVAIAGSHPSLALPQSNDHYSVFVSRQSMLLSVTTGVAVAAYLYRSIVKQDHRGSTSP